MVVDQSLLLLQELFIVSGNIQVSKFASFIYLSFKIVYFHLFYFYLILFYFILLMDTIGVREVRWCDMSHAPSHDDFWS